jgi:cell division protein FtsI (penicillin-binding protein 3)
MKSERKSRPLPRCYVIEDDERAVAIPADRICAESRRARRLSTARRRIVLCATAFACVFFGLAGRLGSVVLMPTADEDRLAIAARAGDPDRSEIVDRNGVLLAVNLPMRALEIAGREVWSAPETAAAVASLIPGVDVNALTAKLADGQYVEVTSRVTPAQERAVFDLGLPGVRFSARIQRFYPQAKNGAHVIGHIEPGKGGVMGLEWALDHGGGPPSLSASIDIRAQQILEEELGLALQKFRAKAAFGGVMDASTGEMLALASLPDFDPNEPGASEADSRRNRMTYDRYELGSAFKLFTAAAALESGVASERSAYDARGYYKVADKIIRDYRGQNRILTFDEVIIHSSNIGAARIAAELGPARQKAALRSFGLLDPLPIELAENRPPELPWQWGPVESATISYGHGISVTPLHLLAAVTAVVNGGVYRAPTFVKAEKPVEGRRVISSDTSAAMRRIMRRVIVEGTAGLADVPDYAPIGKTATAEKPSFGGYNSDARITSFVGAFPGDKPRYVVMISLDDPRPVDGTHGFATAGWNAAPTFAAVTRRLAPVLDVMPVARAGDIAALGRPEAARESASGPDGGAP